MSLSNWSKIDIADHQSELRRLIENAAVEGAFINKSETCIEGDLYDNDDVHCLISINKRGYRAYCSLCGSVLCSHSAVLITCYLENKESFEVVDHVKVPSNWSGALFPFQKHSNKAPQKKSLKKRFQKMLEGLAFADVLLSELLLSIVPQGSSASMSSYKQNLDRLDEFYLSGIKLKFLSLLNSISISGVDESFLFKLNKLSLLVKNSKIELEEELKEDCFENPYSMLCSGRGHVWKMAELEELSKPVDSRLLQLNFSSCENLTAQRIEETGVWLDLNTGSIHVTKNYRPFKALRYIPEGDTEFMILDCKGLVKYPGTGNARVRWRSESKAEVQVEDISKASSMAGCFDKSEQKRLRSELRYSLNDDEVYAYCRVSEFSFRSNTSIAHMNGVPYELQDSYESKLLRSFSLNDLSDSACLLKFEIDKGALQVKPLCVVSDSRIIRLGF